MNLIDLVVDSEGNDLLPQVSTIWCVVAKIVGAPAEDEKSFRVCRTREDLLRIIDSGRVGKVIMHNNSYDLWALYRVWDIPFHLSANGKEDTWNGQPVTFTDTYQISSWLNPDRPGGHSVENLSAIVNGGVTRKVAHEDWSQFSTEMLNRCIMDTVETEKIYHYLMKEWGQRQHV
jgi:hypothetical protein